MNVKDCPICSGEMKLIDGIKYLICNTCRSKIHFGSWEIQRRVMINFNSSDEKICPLCGKTLQLVKRHDSLKLVCTSPCFYMEEVKVNEKI